MEDDHSPNHLRIIGQLAREYEQKYHELEKMLSELPPGKTTLHLAALAERTTDRFRAAQIALFSAPGVFEEAEPQTTEAPPAPTPLLAATALCRAFDEMRILFQFLIENHAETTRPEN